MDSDSERRKCLSIELQSLLLSLLEELRLRLGRLIERYFAILDLIRNSVSFMLLNGLFLCKLQVLSDRSLLSDHTDVNILPHFV